jgi:Acetyltransferase (GNAT) domain
MKPIIPPVDREILIKELNTERFFRPTNKAHNEIYIVNAHNSPNVMREIGRLREISFRLGGGGTGQELDIDEYDTMKIPYNQLIVWDPTALAIVGGYRFLSGKNVAIGENGQPKFVMSHLFNFSDKFIKEYLPYTIELGRAFVQPEYQTSKMGMKSIFALDNLWDGLGALVHSEKTAKYFIGKVTIYQNYNTQARELIYEFLAHVFPDPDYLIRPKWSVEISQEIIKQGNEIFVEKDPASNYKALQKAVRAHNETVPSMFHLYIGLTDTMRTFETIFDSSFGNVYETGIMVTMNDLLESKKKRYIEPYVQYLKQMLATRRANKKAAKAEKLAAKPQKTALKFGKLKRKNGEV